MSRKLFFSWLCWCSLTTGFAQKLIKAKSWEEAMRNPEAVGVLDLSGQKLTALPADIGKFKRLKQLILSNNRLSSLPVEVAKLPHLEKLDVSGNRFRRFTLPVEEMKGLRALNLGKNRLRAIPQSVFSVDSLEKLYLYHNRLRTVSPEIGRLKHLKELRLGGGLRFFWNGNKIKTLPDNIGDLQSLEELHLPDNPIRKLPASFSKLRRLRFLELLHTRFKRVPEEVLALDSLDYVSIWDRNFGESHKNEVATRLPRTRVLYEPKFEGNFTALTVGFRQGKYSEALLGVARAFKKDFLLLGLGATAGYQFEPKAYSVRATIWANFLPTLGLSLVHYGTVGKPAFQHATGFSPEIGVGKGLWRVFYSYTWAWGTFSDYNRHAVQAQICLPIR